MAKTLPVDMSINDAVALIVGMHYTPGTNDLLEMIGHFREEAQSHLDHAKTQCDRDKYKVQSAIHLMREGLARSLFAAIDAELACIRSDGASILEVSDNTFGSEKLITASVCSWANHRGFEIQGWTPPRFWRKKSERTYSTEYLDILDDIVSTFCEDGGEYYQPGITPKKELIFSWVTEKYGAIPDKVLDVMGTIIRPGLTSSTKAPPKR